MHARTARPSQSVQGGGAARGFLARPTGGTSGSGLPMATNMDACGRGCGAMALQNEEIIHRESNALFAWATERSKPCPNR